MRTPRARQRFPRGGENLYELLRLDHEPVLIWVRRLDQTPQWHMAIHEPDILAYDQDADPMVYFWPVDGQMCVCQFDGPVPKESRDRLAKALLRDGCLWVVAMWRTTKEVKPGDWDRSGIPALQWESYGDTDAYMAQRGADAPVPH